MKYSIAKGTFDILPKDPTPDGAWRNSHLWQYVEEVIRDVTKVYGFQEIRTPIFERTELFVRGVGESSDIVTKEMYTFEDRAGRLMTLRPEGTASVMRAFIEKHLDQQKGVHKLYYIGPMFRYERPQAGRFRQHHQFGVEAIGDGSAEQDVEVIDLLCEFYRKLGLEKLTVMLNSVGDVSSRERYRKALRTFLQPKFEDLSAESKVRFEKNVLRILDSKNGEDQKLLEGAPSILDFLSEEAKEHFDRVQSLLKNLKIDYVINPKLVRGLDYYSKTVFEVTAGELGAHNSIGAGGRFDGLSSLLGGPDLPSIGFATGLERVIQTMIGQNVPMPSPLGPLLYFIPLGDAAKEFCLEQVYALRHEGIPTEIDLREKKVGASIERASSIGARFVVVFGEEEMLSKNLVIKELDTREEFSLSLDQLSHWLRNQLMG
ncbi:MAG: Histidine--tRNA ligase [Chlamydiae bacterium]|nr:Histidine--tRNA ligase [Chlamydiota bacterium]